MQKIIHLYRLDSSSRFIILKYLFKRVFKLETTLKERVLNDYYYHLIHSNGFLKEETDYYITSYYSKWESKIRTRKRPSSDLDVFTQIFNFLEYQPVVEIFKANFTDKKGIKIIDAGSNIGLTTLYFSRFFDDATFICIEPNDFNFETLNFNLESNSIPNVQKVKGGIWSKNTNLKLISDFRDKSDWCFRVEETQEKTDLEAFSIPYLIKKFNWDTIDILKIDIEGSEKEIFTNPNSDISFLAITKCIAIEIHDEFNCREDIYDVLKQFNFTFFNSGDLTIGVNQNLVKGKI